MTTFRSLAEFGHELQELGKDLATDEKRRITEDMGKRAQQLARQAASNDLGGNDSFSGWRRNKPMPLETEVKPLPDGAALLKPTRMSAGLWTVAQRGRKQYAAGERRESGTRTRKTDGAVVTKYRKVKRNTGATAGKATADDARRLMERELPKIAAKGVRKAIRKRFD